MKTKFMLCSVVSLIMVLFFTIGCTKYNTLLLQAQYSTLKGSPISSLLQNWGKPNTMVYNVDGTSELAWKNIYSTPEDENGLIPENVRSSMQKSTAMLCSVTITVDPLGKVNTHSLLCYADKAKRKPQEAVIASK